MAQARKRRLVEVAVEIEKLDPKSLMGACIGGHRVNDVALDRLDTRLVALQTVVVEGR